MLIHVKVYSQEWLAHRNPISVTYPDNEKNFSEMKIVIMYQKPHRG